MTDVRPTLPRLLLGLAALLALSLPARAGDSPPDVELTQGKNGTATFDLGFKLTCLHELIVDVDDEHVLCAVKPPSKTKKGKVKLRFEAKNPGTTNVTVSWFGIGENCSGSASVRLILEVTPDLKATVKEIKTVAKDSLKAIKAKIKLGQKVFCSELKDLEKQFKDGDLSLNELADESRDLMNGTLFGLSLVIYECLRELNLEVANQLVSQAFDELISEAAVGTCDSEITAARRSACADWEKAAAFVTGKRDKLLKKLGKDELETASWTMSMLPGVDRLQPPSLNGSITGTGDDPPYVLGYTSFDNLARGLNLSIAGYVDEDQSQVQLDVIGTQGSVWSGTVMAHTFPDFLSENGLDGKGLLGPDDPDIAKVFSQVLFTNPGFLPAPDAPPMLTSGPYRIELKYPGDTNADVVLYFSVP